MDGVEQTLGSALRDPLGNSTDMTGATAKIGGGVASRYSVAKIRDVQIYDYSVSDAQALELSRGGILGPGGLLLFEGEMDSWELTEKQIKVKAIGAISKWTRSTLLDQAPLCRWRVFKGTECTYAGGETWCDRTYTRCVDLGNTANFGGDRWLASLDGVTLWWGPAPKW